MVGSDEPFGRRIFGRERLLDVFKIVIRREVEGVRGGHVLINERVILDDTEFLGWVEIVTLSISEEFFSR